MRAKSLGRSKPALFLVLALDVISGPTDNCKLEEDARSQALALALEDIRHRHSQYAVECVARLFRLGLLRGSER